MLDSSIGVAPALLDAPARGPMLDAEDLNRACACTTLDPVHLRRQLDAEPALAGLAADIALSRPHLLSSTAVFITPAQRARMDAIARAVQEVATRARYRDAALRRAPDVAGVDLGPQGVFLGFDFHLSARGPQLIEINTNAGGALLNAALARAQRACCDEVAAAFAPSGDLSRLEESFFAMFESEWRLQRGGATLARVAIADDAPAEQYLYPEFRLFAQMFARFGVEAMIVDARELEWRDGRLAYRGKTIDLVYNRLTDFYFERPEHAALRDAYLAGAAVVTPHPRAHALYADKRNLITLSDADALAALGIDSATREILVTGVPRTVAVGADNAEALWAQRRRLFFKPAAGYGGKAAYRGDKLTRRAWDEILARPAYVAQALIPPSERVVSVDGAQTDLKLDLRAYVYAGRTQLLAARLYRGQTTNFRTAGGGFAPVFVLR
jgi:glutathione synthase/RimK-type ligase-like ATP-grasp enzyme